MSAPGSNQRSNQPTTISGIDAMRGVGGPAAKGFWADAWSRVLQRPTAIAGLTWLSIVAFFAIFAPIVANGHPLLVTRFAADGSVASRHSPLWESLTSADLLLVFGGVAGLLWMLLPIGVARSTRLGALVVAALQAGFTLALATAVAAWFSSPERFEETRRMAREPWFPWVVTGGVALLLLPLAALIPTFDRRLPRAGLALLVAIVSVITVAERWKVPVRDLDTYHLEEASGRSEAIFTLVPWSPEQGSTGRTLLPPGTRYGEVERDVADAPSGKHGFWLGTDNIGRDVLACMMHACRLSISIGLVSTGIAVLIGVVIGSLMGYFGGKIDLVLFRVVETFMAIPVLFLMIVAAGVLPRNTYVMMVIIGCVTWTGSARFIRAEFLKLRNQDFVSSAKAVGLPLHLILFRHMLPNGVTPVLVDASFAIAAAITFEATLSFLGLGPEGQASWGQLLSSAKGATGLFKWWLATFPGVAIFLTVLSYNMLGEAFRDAIDPKLRKAAL